MWRKSLETELEYSQIKNCSCAVQESLIKEFVNNFSNKGFVNRDYTNSLEKRFQGTLSKNENMTEK